MQNYNSYFTIKVCNQGEYFGTTLYIGCVLNQIDKIYGLKILMGGRLEDSNLVNCMVVVL